MTFANDPHRLGRHAAKNYALGNPDQRRGRHRAPDDDDRAAGAGCALGLLMLPLALFGALWPEGRRRKENPPKYSGAHSGKGAKSRGCLEWLVGFLVNCLLIVAAVWLW